MAADALEEVPVLDLAATPAAEAAAVVDAALRRFGFFYVAGHGIPEELIAAQCVPAPQRRAAPPAQLDPCRRVRSTGRAEPPGAPRLLRRRAVSLGAAFAR